MRLDLSKIAYILVAVWLASVLYVWLERSTLDHDAFWQNTILLVVLLVILAAVSWFTRKSSR